MRRDGFHDAGIVAIVLAAGLLLMAPGANPGGPQEGPPTGPVATTSHFALHSDFATNLNDALIAAGTQRRFERPELFDAGAEKDCFEGLPLAERAAWDRAADYYAEVVAPSGNFGREQILLRNELADLPQREESPENRRFLEIAGGFRAAAAPVYRACRWAAQDEANRRWVDELTPLLAAHEETIAPRLEQLYQTPFHGLPIRVDVVPAALRTGASTIIMSPAGGHILVSSLDEANQGNAALEVVFHEASHTIAAGWRGDPVPEAVAEAAEALGVPEPEDLWHVILFYTTGETVRRVLEEAGEPGYTPYLYQGLFERAWPEYQKPIESVWPSYLDGERTLSEAVTELVRTLSDRAGGTARGPGR